MKAIVRFCAIGLAMLCLCWALGAPSPASAQEKLKLRVVFSTSVSTPILPYLVAKDRGWYAKNGLEVEELFVAGDANGLRAVISGTGDVVQLGLATVFQAITEGAKIKTIGAWQPLVDYQVIAANGVASTLPELAGKTFASYSPSDLTTEIPKMLLKKHGVDPATLRFIPVGGHPERLQAVEAGKVQASMVNTLIAKKGVLDGKIKIISAVKDDFPLLGFSYLVTTEEILKNPKMRKAFEILLKGGMIGARYIMDNPDGAAEVLFKRTPDIPIALIKAVIPDLNKLQVWGVNGGLDPKIVQFTSDVSVQLQMISRAVPPQEAIDASLVDAVLAQIGKR